MNRLTALAWLGLLAVATWLALVAPLPAVLLLLALALAARPGVGMLALVVSSVLVQALILGLFLGWPGSVIGASAGLRIATAITVNLAILAAVSPARLLDGLALAPRLTAWLAAVILAAADVGRDAQLAVATLRFEGAWPATRRGQIRAAAGLLPAIIVQAHARATARREALRLAGHDMPAGFVPVVAVAALAAAGRVAFLALPNVALTYVAVFLGGLLWGWRAGALGGALGMVATNFLITGLVPTAYVNVPAMALVGALGGWLPRRWFVPETAGRWSVGAARANAATVGVAATLLFSVVSDAATWALVPETRGNLATLAPLLLGGLVFNVLPALANGALFALGVMPVTRALEAAGVATGPVPEPGGRPASHPVPVPHGSDSR